MGSTANMSDGTRVVDSDKVYAVLVTNKAYLPGLFTLEHSLRKVGSRYPLIALYTPSLPDEAHAAIDLRGIPKQRVEYLLPADGKDYSDDPRFFDCWSKLTSFSLTQYARIVQLDADMLVRRNLDELMDLELDSPELAATGDRLTSKRVLAAAHACVCNPLQKPHYPRDWVPYNCAMTAQHADPSRAQTEGTDPAATPLRHMNSGLLVVNPSAELYTSILDLMRKGGDAIASMDFADQSLLSDLFDGRWAALPYVYNALKTLRWPGVHDAIWRDDDVKVVHYILAPKPWDERVGPGQWAPTKFDADEVTHRWWRDVDDERRAAEQSKGIDDVF